MNVMSMDHEEKEDSGAYKITITYPLASKYGVDRNVGSSSMKSHIRIATCLLLFSLLVQNDDNQQRCA